MIDSHFHSLQMGAKGLDPVASVARCCDLGVNGLLDVGLHPNDLNARLSLFQGVAGVSFSSGFAPAEAASNNWRDSLTLLEDQIESDSMVAIGEIGLDWYWNYGSKKAQIDLLSSQLELARKFDIPVIIHNREADDDIVRVLKSASLTAAGVMHCFTSNYTFASACLDLGFMISFAGNLTYKKSDTLRETARQIPNDMLLAETDSPYMTPQPMRGKTNTPEYIVHTYEVLADLRGVKLDTLAATIESNYARLFRLNDQE